MKAVILGICCSLMGSVAFGTWALAGESGVTCKYTAIEAARMLFEFNEKVAAREVQGGFISENQSGAKRYRVQVDLAAFEVVTNSMCWVTQISYISGASAGRGGL